MSCHATQLNLRAIFDAPAARKRKASGIAKAQSARQKLVAECREYAREHAAYFGTVTADDVQAWLLSRGLTSADLGNGAGAIFQHGFVRIGYTQSTRASSNCRVIAVWRLA